MKRRGPIRLFVEAHAFDCEHQGTRSFISRLYSDLVPLLPNVVFYFGACDIRNLRKELSHIPNARFVKYWHSSTIWRLAFQIPWILIRHRIHFSHFQYILPLFAPGRKIVTTHDVLFLDFPDHFPAIYRVSRRFFFRNSVLRADLVTTVSRYSLSRIAFWFKIPEQEIVLTPSGVTREVFEPYDPLASRQYVATKFGFARYILCVSRFEPRKNQTLLVAAYLKLRLYEEHIQLVLIGHESIETPTFLDLLRSCPAEARSHIVVLDKVNETDLGQLYRAASVFVYPSLAEGFGLPPIEAAALRIPVLCSGTTAMNDFDFFEEGLFDPNREGELEHKLRHVLDNPPPADSLAQIANEVRRRYTFKESAAALARAINELEPASLGQQA